MNINYINFNNTTRYNDGKVPYITFRNFEKLKFIRHGFSTRLGGISKGVFSTMNLTFTRGDDEDAVRENFRLMGDALGISPENMVYAKQTHTTNVLAVNEKYCGMGVVRERSFDDVDGFVTNRPGVALVTSYADCVPVFLADPVQKSIGLVHSGWRGTVNNIAKVAVDKMVSLYNSHPENIVAFIGPSICRNCYEVGTDVAEQFAQEYKDNVFDGILYPVKPDAEYGEKFRLDLHRANVVNLLGAGIKEENIGVTDICTCCNPELLFSHRYTKGRRGNLSAFLSLRG